MEICAKPRNKPQFQGRTKVKFYFDAKAENVRANRIQVQQLLVNLLRNANDAMTVFGEPRQLDDGRRGEAGVLPDDRHHWNTDFRKDVRRHRSDGGDAKKNDQRCQHVESVREPQRKSNNGHDLLARERSPAATSYGGNPPLILTLVKSGIDNRSGLSANVIAFHQVGLATKLHQPDFLYGASWVTPGRGKARTAAVASL